MGTNITGIGNANAIGFKSRVTGGAYFPPELKDALVGVWSAYGKSNDSTDRNIIKNKIKDKGGDFVISNAAFKLNSGFGKYEVDFTSWIQTDGVIASSDKVQNSIIGRFLYFNTVNKKEDVPSFKVNITLGQQSKLQYNYIKEDGTTTYIVYSESDIYTIPASYFSKYTGGNAWFGFYQIEGTSIIEQIPSFEGAFVTDGIDDQIVSTKTIQEMLGGSNEITVVSMIHLVQTPAASSEKAYTNQIRTGQNYLRNYVTDNGKTGIYGYTCKGNNVSVINNILGDKNDYTVENKSWNNLAKFSVIGYEDNGTINELDQVAWYWTFIAKRVLTEDEINLVIEKYNLDRPGEIVKPQVYYNVKKQKISNDNHSAFDDKLIDYSGNGYDAKLYNFGWKEDSGIGKYETDFTDWKKSFKVTSFDSESIKFTSDVPWVLLYHPSSIGEDIPSFKVRIKLYGKGTLYYNYITQEGKYTNVAVKSEIFETPICYNTKYTGEKGVNVGFTLGVTSGECSGTITQIPEYENALVLDGVDDYGKVTGLPILKDYTFLVDRQIINIGDVQRIVASKSESATDTAKQGAFLFEYLSKNSISTWSYYENNPLVANADFNRDISYQSKYIYNGKELTIGGAGDSDKLWLGTIRDKDSRFFNGAIYLLMLFPYSMSEFLIERQIEKVKGGTLYPNQVEFRPIIPEDENITKIDYFVVNSGTWTVIKPGDYVDVGARIVLNVYTKLPYKIAGASSTAFTGMTVGPSTALNIWDVKGYIKDKTPQKIKLTLAVNEDIVQWNPAITSNLLDSFTASSWYLNGWDNTLTVGTWIKKTDRVFFKATFKTELYGLETATFGGTECVVSKADNWSDSKNIWDIRMLGTVGDLSQIFNLDVYELIRFEDIVQPYPVLLRFKDENGNEVSWGGKFRVGSTITRIGSAADSNLLPNIYNIFGLLLNDNQVTSSKVIVEKTMVFKAKSAYIFDNNEPKCILSPSRLRIPNSSYKLLGYIPDISGHGNHGKINNSAYAGMSGVNGYPVVFGANKTWANESNGYVTSITNNTIHITNVLNAGLALLYSYVKYNGNLQNIKEIPPFKIEIKGLEGRSKFIYKYLATSDATKETNLYLGNGTHELPKSFLPTEALISNAVVGFSISPIEEGVTNFLSDITIKVLPEYEGAYCLYGVDDFVTIPTVTGGKQVLMKVNWDSPNASILYDQRGYNNEFAIYNGTNDSDGNPIPAYQGRNNGQTYIDGILNSNIKASELRAITHNITITNELSSGTNKTYPIIGSSKSNAYFVNMALYDFMLFDEISTDDKIKELNEYVGTEGNIVEWNPTITSNIPYKDMSTYITTDGIIDSTPKVGNLYKKGDKLTIGIKPVKDLDEVGTVTINGVKIKRSSLTELGYYIYDTVLDSTQIIDITIDEYIKYEDIVQPYPSLFTLINYDTEEVYSWGSKLKIGAKFKGNVANLLPDMYEWQGDVLYNGEPIYWNTTPGVVAKEMVFSWNMPFKYLKTNAPKCIFSPSKLRMPNESYRYLGYIPDISGNGNNGVFNNFAFSKMSGADGYPYDYKSTSDFVAHARNAVLVNSETVKFINVLTQTSFYYRGTSYKGKIKVTGITKAIASGKVRYLDIYSNSPTNNDRVIIDKDGIYDVNIETEDAINIFFYLTPIVSGTTALDEPVYLEQVGNYEGAICFDGIDDYVDIPSLSIGGKQVLMKTNWLKSPTLLYDQRASGSFAILTTKEDDATNPRIAYQARNQDGKTYIDGIENNYIETYSLKGITHNITATNPSAGSGVVPVIGANTGKSSGFAKMALYDFMLFDEVSTDEEIKQLNDIVGIEGGYVQKPPYYWDAYGKTNSDADRDTIQQRGIAVGDYDLINNNFAYEGMSGYNGYPAVFGANKTYANLVPNDGNFILTSSHNIINVTKFDTSYGLLYSHIKLDGKLTSRNIDYPSYKIKVTGLGENFGLHYSYLKNPSDANLSAFGIGTDGTYTIPKSFASDGSLINNNVWIGFIFTGTAPESCNVTIEVLPEYENGLVYDGVDDYSENTSIPAFTDYTYIIKYEDFNNPNTGSCIQRKGSIKAGGGAFVQDHIYRGTKYQYNFGISSNIHKDDSIAFCTKTNYNGTAIPSGNNTDDTGFTIGKFDGYRKMVFYKEMLYPRTVNMLTINMIKNMMAEDGIIDIQGKLFTDKFTGDFNLDFNKDFLIGN